MGLSRDRMRRKRFMTSPRSSFILALAFDKSEPEKLLSTGNIYYNFLIDGSNIREEKW